MFKKSLHCMGMLSALCFVFALSATAQAQAQEGPAYKSELGIVYYTVDGKPQKLNAFLPEGIQKPAPVMVDIHGGWWSVGAAGTSINRGDYSFMTGRGIAIFSIDYRLGKDGGFPENIRDCRNAVRFIRKNATRFNIDPDRIGCFGGSAGSHLSMMLAMVPEDFDDGGPPEELKGISAKVCNAFAFVGPTDFVRQWNESVTGKPNDSHPYHRVLFKGIEPDTDEHKALYMKMSPMGHLRKDVSPLLICDGENDPIVPNLQGKTLNEKLQEIGADSTYWMSPKGGHAFPSGPGFEAVLEKFLVRTLKLDDAK